MPIHDWTRVDAGIFHHFHQRWIVAITDVLNRRLLPAEYYALAEQQGAGFEPDILTLKAGGEFEPDDESAPAAGQEPPARPAGASDPRRGCWSPSRASASGPRRTWSSTAASRVSWRSGTRRAID